jgi:hypothetical protein
MAAVQHRTAAHPGSPEAPSVDPRPVRPLLARPPTRLEPRWLLDFSGIGQGPALERKSCRAMRQRDCSAGETRPCRHVIRGSPEPIVGSSLAQEIDDPRRPVIPRVASPRDLPPLSPGPGRRPERVPPGFGWGPASRQASTRVRRDIERLDRPALQRSHACRDRGWIRRHSGKRLWRSNIAPKLQWIGNISKRLPSTTDTAYEYSSITEEPTG